MKNIHHQAVVACTATIFAATLTCAMPGSAQKLGEAKANPLPLAATNAAQGTTRRFDFGAANAAEPGYSAVGPDTAFSAQAGYGWLAIDGLELRNRTGPDALRRDFIYGKKPHVFRIAGLRPGTYTVTVICGDMEYGNHVTVVGFTGSPKDWPALEPALAEFVTLKANATVEKDSLDITFDSPINNWIINAIVVEPTTAIQPFNLSRQKFAPLPVQSTWPPVLTSPDPTRALLQRFRKTSNANARNNPAPRGFQPTGLKRDDYLKLIAGQVDFWKGHQDAEGAIIDPYRKVEFQYSTPAFAHAGAILVARAGRMDLLEPAAKAMDWATSTLSRRKAANAHEDFYPPMLAHALPLLRPHVAAERAARWEAEIRGFEPFQVYRTPAGANNWNVVALAGEALFQQMGVRDRDNKFVVNSLAGQGKHFTSPHGLYLEGPMAYDHFPRLWLADMIAHNYAGPYRAEVTETLRRAAITSLFMQSPWGELPAGGRSAHHQWNEAEQCVTYEVFAARALREGDATLAAIYKRAAHLALASMRRWVRPSGEMQIVKNWVDPAQNHAFEGYSAHSQYNLLPMSMLALAYENAEPTETIAERPAPADVGGFMLEIPQLHKVFANAGGTYVETDTNADHHYDATGLIRIHVPGVSPQLGPSDSVLEKPYYRIPANSPTTAYTGVGVAWQHNGAWRRLGELSRTHIERVRVTNVRESSQRVSYDIVYEGKLFGVARIVEHYEVRPGRVTLTTELPGYTGPLRYIWPVLADDGRTQSTLSVANGIVMASQDGGKTAQTFTAQGAGSVQIEAERYPNHNGWARLAVAEYPRGGKITLVIAPKISIP